MSRAGSDGKVEALVHRGFGRLSGKKHCLFCVSGLNQTQAESPRHVRTESDERSGSSETLVLHHMPC